jgi:hypothetical protein
MMLLCIVGPAIVQANDTQIITNSVQASSHTGNFYSTGADGIDGTDGRPGQNGTDGSDGTNFVEGKSSASTRIISTVDGKTVLDIDETHISDDGSPAISVAEVITSSGTPTQTIGDDSEIVLTIEEDHEDSRSFKGFLESFRLILLTYVNLLF